MNSRSFHKVINSVFTLALAFGLLLPASTTLALPQKAAPMAAGTATPPNDPGYTAPGIDNLGNAGTQYQWNLSDVNLSGTWGINAPAAWIITTGSASTVVAVIDSGLAPNDDLGFDTSRILDGYDFITNSVNANDLGGRDADASDPGDWCDLPLPDGVDSSWHGSHIAGIIGATTNNGAGIAGIDWAAKILPVRVSGKCGVVNAADLMDGMSWAAGLPVTGVTTNLNPADVINVSVGVPGEACTTHQAAINAIIAAGAVIVAAAGDNDSTVIDFPANCAGVITVAATDKLGSRASYSNKGPLVEISAPGGGNGQGDVLSTTNSNNTTPNIDDATRYTTKAGTGIAAAHVSGVVSLMLAGNPAMTPSQIFQTLQQTAQAFPTTVGIPCDTSICGSGIVDARGALKPDLIITNVGLAPLASSSDECPASQPLYSPGPDELFCVNITLKNLGGSNSGSIAYRNVFVDRDPSLLPRDVDGCIVDNNGDPDYGDYFRKDFNASIPAGAEVTQGVKIYVSAPPPPVYGLPAGAHAIYAYADAQCSIEEVFLNNNNFAPVVIGGTVVNVEIGGLNLGAYPLAKGSSARKNYVGVDSGPVKVASTGGTPIISAIRSAWAVNGVTTSFSQLMGLPLEQLSDTYVFPGYNNVTLNDQLRISNVDTLPTTVTVTIGGTLRGTYPLAAGAAVRINYPGLDSGPVVVQGTSGVKIISSIREAWAVNGVTRSFVQLMGLPAGQLSNKYVFPAYNNVTLNEQLRIGNVDTVATSVTVTIGGTLRGTYPLGPGQAVRINYPGLDSGPVVVEGTAGVNIISSIRSAWAVNGVTTSFSQLMGMPAGQLSDQYLFPAYNNVTLNDQLRISNVDTVPSTVTVTIGGNLKGTYPLAAGAAVRINYAGLDSGPVVVQGTSGVKIISSIREAWAVNGVTQSFVQLMGLPAGQLSTTYLFPAYNNITLNEQLRFGVP